MEKTTIYGLPLTPRALIEQLEGASFCVSFATRKDLGSQLDDAIRLVGNDGILLIDNGAFTLHKKGVSTRTESYQDEFETWAADILERCPQAIAVIPDVIGGTEEENGELVRHCMLDWDRCMPIWHLHESIDYLLELCEGFNYVGFGSSGQFWKVGTPEWHARIAEAFAAIDAWEKASEGAYIRPRIHMMRAQSMAHLYGFDSSDSSNLAVNHCRYKATGEGHVERMADRIDGKIQASAGPEAEHQAKRPLLFHVEAAEANAAFWLEMELARLSQKAAANADGLDIPDFLKRAA